MDLSPKAIRFIIDALEHYVEHFDQLVGNENLSDDELADLSNDQRYLAALRQSLQLQHAELLKSNAMLSQSLADASTHPAVCTN